MKYHLLFSSTLILLSSVLTANATDNKSLKYTINDRSIVFPFSSDPNNVKIDDNWYLNNFAILDTEGQDYRDATDSELRKRLEELSKHTHRHAFQPTSEKLHRAIFQQQEPQPCASNAGIEPLLHAHL